MDFKVNDFLWNFIIPFVEELKEEISKPEVVARIKYETSDAFRLDESKRPKDSGPIESFRKLNVDWRKVPKMVTRNSCVWNNMTFLVEDISVVDPGFSGGRQLLRWVGQPIISTFSAENYIKLKEFGPRGDARPWSLAPPWILQSIFSCSCLLLIMKAWLLLSRHFTILYSSSLFSIGSKRILFRRAMVL